MGWPIDVKYSTSDASRSLLYKSIGLFACHVTLSIRIAIDIL